MENSDVPMFLTEGREHLQELNLAVVRVVEQPGDIGELTCAPAASGVGHAAPSLAGIPVTAWPP